MNSPDENAKLTIDQFNVSEEIRQMLKRVGFSEIGEVTELLAGMRSGTQPSGLIRNMGERNMNEIIAQLKLLELWPFED